MKKTFSLFFLMFAFCRSGIAQNVGIGTNTPLQKLDVAGNINTTGNIMVNGIAGNDGQVLAMNGSTMKWMDKSRFNNWAIYPTAGSASFTVPPGVSEVMIEMWGAGGGGHYPGGGGGSGGYWLGIIPVTGITTINLTVGTGGAGGSTSTPGSNGGNTSFSCTGFSVAAGGGIGADSSLVSGFSEVYKGGGGGQGLVPGSTLPAGYRNYFFLNGNPGTATKLTFIQIASTEFSRYYTYGLGGVSPMSGQVQRPEIGTLFNSSIPDVQNLVVSGSSTDFGSGGNGYYIGNGFPGGPGRIVIYY